jgi:hypothetical protein
MTSDATVKALQAAALAVADAKARIKAGMPIDEFPGASEQEAIQLVWNAWYQRTLAKGAAA